MTPHQFFDKQTTLSDISVTMQAELISMVEAITLSIAC